MPRTQITDQNYARWGRSASLPLTCAVWRVLTRASQTTIIAIADELGIAPSSVHRAICMLEDRGYITRKKRGMRARGVVVGYAEIGADHVHA